MRTAHHVAARRDPLRRLISAATFAVISAWLLIPPADAASSAARCQEVEVPVEVAAIGPAEIYGQLCLPAGPVPDTVQLLVHGATYTHEYWNWRQQPETYSYVDRAVAAGYATFAVDRLGAGRSTRPAGAATVNFHTGGDALHQVIEKLRDGVLTAGDGFARVIWLGHSMGSVQAWVEAAAYPDDVDAYVITGMAHQADPARTPELMSATYPAMLDPKFSGTIVDPDYLTTVPGRRSVFYDTASADAAVIERDEIFKDTVTTSELTQTTSLSTRPAPPRETSPSRAIDVPTFVVLSHMDVGWMTTCAEPDPGDCEQQVLTEERPYYGPGAQLQVTIVPGGHDINLHRGASDAYTDILNWIDSLD